jgi:hypothetical protein
MTILREFDKKHTKQIGLVEAKLRHYFYVIVIVSLRR